MGKDASDIRQEIEVTRADLGDTVDALAYQTDVKARVKDAVDGKVSTVKETVANATASAKENVETGMGRALDNPLGLVGGAFALGLLAGMFLPVTEIERQRVGPIKDDLVERGKSAVAEKAQAVVDSVMTSTHSA